MRLSRATARAVTLAAALAALGCRERAARLMGVDSSVPPPEPRAEEPEQVHFTITGPTSVMFSWRGSTRQMRVWSKQDAPRTIEAHEVTPKPFSTSGVWLEAEVTNLRPDTEYGYEVGRPRLPFPAFFRTPPAPGTAGFAFAAFANLGASVDDPEVRAIHRLVALGEPAFVLGLGDLTYADLHGQRSVDAHFEDALVWSRVAAYMPVWGEHEWAAPQKDDLRNYKGRFTLPHAQASPGAPAAGCCGEDWWWFDYGNVRFIAYPEPYTDATWEDWGAKAAPLFAEAQASPAIELVVTMGHRPAYSSSPEGGDARLRRVLDSFGARFPKYVLNLNGHAPVYERTKPQAHVVHLTVGAGGGELAHAETPCSWKECKAPAFTAFRAIHHAFVRFSSRPGALKVEAFCGAATLGRDDVRCADGEILDNFVVGGQAPPRAPQERSAR